MSDTYLTIAGESQGLYKEKGSKFMAFAYAVKSEDEIKSCLDGLKKKYYDATHHCYAYVLGSNQEKYRANDDGEPNHSAGDPILGQIRSKNLTNILVVVVRYYGGTKLGVSGLINAYRTATAEALEVAEIEEKVVTLPLKIRYSYEETNEVMRLIQSYGLDILTQEFTVWCEMTLGVRKSLLEEVQSKLENWIIEENV